MSELLAVALAALVGGFVGTLMGAAVIVVLGVRAVRRRIPSGAIGALLGGPSAASPGSVISEPDGTGEPTSTPLDEQLTSDGPADVDDAPISFE